MPKTVGQWTGLLVTIIIVLGRDSDVIAAMPLGVMAGILATIIMMAADAREEAKI